MFLFIVLTSSDVPTLTSVVAALGVVRIFYTDTQRQRNTPCQNNEDFDAPFLGVFCAL